MVQHERIFQLLRHSAIISKVVFDLITKGHQQKHLYIKKDLYYLM